MNLLSHPVGFVKEGGGGVGRGPAERKRSINSNHPDIWSPPPEKTKKIALSPTTFMRECLACFRERYPHDGDCCSPDLEGKISTKSAAKNTQKHDQNEMKIIMEAKLKHLRVSTYVRLHSV